MYCIFSEILILKDPLFAIVCQSESRETLCVEITSILGDGKRLKFHSACLPTDSLYHYKT